MRIGGFKFHPTPMRHNKEHHQAMEGLVNLFTKANHDLTVVQHRLEKEFQQVYTDKANPMKLVSRMKKLQEDLLTLKGQCHVLLAAKQDLIDKAWTTLVGSRSLLQRMQAFVGIPLTSDSDVHLLTSTRSLMSGRFK